ncbi:MAG TPA: hypothetical protein DCX46_08050 [Bacteroidetes bacterium]|nr:MAG: hypothetical protein A2X68_11535 [Ignavibacteria bacterium GWC2_56_12]OGU63141.1 MAG: hypothetical protein A3C56_06595 [Ignavibacteria bacterium RIFCSPHIGHO2_02_FULL_56_12]HAV23432.1 hypothetical protein [Bacteroidota bacterium]
MIRVQLPSPLRTLARIDGEVEISVDGPATIASVIDAVEARYPMLTGTIREHHTGKRRAYVRYFACGRDLSHEQLSSLVPEEVAAGKEPLIVLGAISGG